MTKKEDAWRRIVIGVIICLVGAACLHETWLVAMQSFLGGHLCCTGMTDLKDISDEKKK